MFRTIIVLKILIVSFGGILSGTAIFAQQSYPIIESRCQENNLSIDQAHGRNRWSKKCKTNFTDEEPNFVQKLDIFNSVSPGRPYYPLVSDESSQDYNAPTEESRGCEKYTKYHAFCLSSCFTPDQKILFFDGEIIIKNAMNDRKTDVMALTKESTLDNFELYPQPVEAYQETRQDALEAILAIYTESGIELKVTEEHPILLSSGIMTKAKDLVIGQKLIKESGDSDTIINIKRESYFGKVYNIAPASTHPAENIIVAQGLLVGSANFQYHELFKDLMYRKILREMINVNN